MRTVLDIPSTRRSLLQGVAATSAFVMLHPFAARAAVNQAHLRIMETTDIHVAVYPYDYYADAPDDKSGLARTATIIDKIRSEAGNSMLIDNGDFLQGNPLGDFIAYQRGMKDGDLHPVIKAMNILGYECGTLGNHEFNYGLDFMFKVMQGANFPYVCANLTKGQLASDPRKDDLYLKPYRIVEKKIKDGSGAESTVKIGFIGFVPPQIMIWDSKNLEGKAQTRDIVEAAKAWVPVMKEDGADLVIALSHSGIDGARPSERMENASLYLAGVEGIDAVFTGHQHLVFPGTDTWDGIAGADPKKGTLMGKPAVMAGFWGSHMGLVDLLLEKDGKSWKIVDSTVEARPIYHREGKKVVADVGDDRRIIDAIKAEHEATLAYIRKPVGKTSAPLYSYFALVADDPSVQIVSQAQLWYLKDILKSSQYKDLPMLSAAAPFKCGGRGGAEYYTDVPAGNIAIKNASDLYLYPNTLRGVLITGAEVRNWLEMSAGIFNEVKPGTKDTALINLDFPSYNYDVIDGVTYQIDLSQPPKYDRDGKLINPDSNRIVNLQFDGKPIDPAQKFVVATNNYRAGGGGNFPDIKEDKIVFVAPDTNRDVLVRYIIENGTINPTADDNWTFKPLPGTSVTFESGPKARNFIKDVKSVRIEDAGEGENGFAKFRIML
jgi:2',3'-cyclic-nucleotide 2'-phosphodiesterase/3'-nucleotidase